MKTAKLNCPACDQKLEIPASLLGGFVVCPNCQRGFAVPGRPPRPVSHRIFLGGFAALAAGLIFLAAVNADARELILSLVLFTCGVVVYFAPYIVALQRDHRQREAIFILNLLAGWTVIGWIAAAVWAHTQPAR
jgi:hypothetical protein